MNTAAGPGLEPRLHDSESCVLPLDDPAIGEWYQKKHTISITKIKETA